MSRTPPTEEGVSPLGVLAILFGVFVVAYALFLLVYLGAMVFYLVRSGVRHWLAAPPLEQIFLSQIAVELVGGLLIALWQKLVIPIVRRRDDRQRGLEKDLDEQAEPAPSDDRRDDGWR